MSKSMEIDARIDELLANLKPITLDEMKEIRLMNRTDTKFVTNKETLARLLEMAQGRSSCSGRRDGESRNLRKFRLGLAYWDTDAYRFYLEHHNGRAPRQKVRVRTYMDSNDTFLEVKTKNNHGRTKKKRVAVPSQEITGENGNEEFLQEKVHLGLADIHPTVRNQFHRITLVNYGKTERLTIDYDVHFHNFETGKDANVGPLVIIELKRDGNVYSPVLDILRELRIKPSGFSKYCIGSVMTNKGIKQNLFKARLVKLSRLAGHKLQAD